MNNLTNGPYRAIGAALILSVAMAAPAAAGRAVPNVSDAASHEAVVKDLISHRAVFDMKLTDSKASSSIAGLNGRMVFETIGSTCDGFTINFRFVTQVEDSQGNSRLTDMRTTTFEDASGDRFEFLTQTYIDEKLVEESKGSAVRDGETTTVSLDKPEKKTFTIAKRILFPTQHLVAMLSAARSGEAFLPANIYDGSETGEKIFPTATTIGKRIDGPDTLDAKAADADMSKLPRWPVTVGYFEPVTTGGEALPTYEMSFLLYGNGISRDVKIDYGDFSVAGKLVNLEIHDVPGCDADKAGAK
ncbi:cell envelope integrity EipB family protein [Rhodobium gokarnense]|uniref:ATP-binding protein n=1 Tax=Rhodobium gokarnense TaxID=364296 RepID=A0ABT3HA51_9HYPH|nr:cell envelope integrity EipB family protein [Rhodobium gokarnense]MCW2307265.1 hypothetical protein [Rhodobium gokarnense]